MDELNTSRGRRSLAERWMVLAAMVLFAVVVSVSSAARPPMPVDETRYLSQAWEMWTSGDLLVPHLNGEPNSHKPPLLFWAIVLGWKLFGVSATVALLVPMVFGAASLPLVWRLFRALWPNREASEGPAVALALAGSFVWILISSVLFFDVVLCFFVLLAFLGLVRSASGQAIGWLWLLLGIAGGGLTKGPVIMIHVLAGVLAIAFWPKSERRPLGPWLLGVLLAILGGAGLVLAWAISAGNAGGEAYREALFVTQTAGRVVRSFAHRHPVWWYLPWLPILSMPFIIWPTFWQRARRAPWMRDRGLRFCFLTSVVILGVFSLISGKQPQYLLPIVPLFALTVTRITGSTEPGVRRRFSPLALFPLLMLGLATTAWLSPATFRGSAAEIAQEVPFFSVLLLLGALAIALAPMLVRGFRESVAWVAVVTSVTCIGMFVMLSPIGAKFDLRPAAQAVASAQQAGRAIAWMGPYHGELQFVGRLEAPVDLIDEPEIQTWLEANPSGLVVIPYRGAAREFPCRVQERFRLRNKELILCDRPAA